MKFVGDRRHTMVVRRLMTDEVASGRIKLTATTVRFDYPNRDHLVVLEQALDRVWPEWRSNPLAYRTDYQRFRRDARLLLQIRASLCRQMNLDPQST